MCRQVRLLLSGWRAASRHERGNCVARYVRGGDSENRARANNGRATIGPMPKSKKTEPTSTAPLAHNPFAALAGKLAAAEPSPARPIDVPAPAPAPPHRAVVRIERKGRAGKEVTIVERMELDHEASAQWLKALKASLGCGGVAQDGVWVLQGDQRERVRVWLAGRGVERVTVAG